MCLALPARIVERRDGDMALAEVGGVRKPVSLALLDGVEPGDWVIVHVGYALTRLDPQEAERTLALLADLPADTADPPVAPSVVAETVPGTVLETVP